MKVTVTLIVIPAKNPDAFEAISPRNRKRESRGWVTFEFGSGRFLDTFLMKATKVDLSVFACEDREDWDSKRLLQTCLLTNGSVTRRLPALEKLVEEDPDQTAAALHQHGGGTGNLARIKARLKSGSWPKQGDAAEETAAFAHQLLIRMRRAKELKMGVCWEYRGKVSA